MKSTTDLTGYARPWIVHAGDTVEFMISSNRPDRCDLSVFRVVCADIDPEGPGAEFERQLWGEAAGLKVRFQHISAGSCARADTGPASDPALGLRLRLAFFPTLRTDAPQTLFSFGSIRVWITPEGRLSAQTEAAEMTCSDPMDLRQWYRAELMLNPATHQIELTWERIRPLPDRVARQTARAALHRFDWPDASSPLMLAAEPAPKGGAKTQHHFNGKIEAPSLATHDGTPLAGWDFADNQGAANVRDLGPGCCDLRLVNTPMRGATGHAWNGNVEHWELKPEHYAAIHFHEDDMTDCGWESTVTIPVPEAARSGFYIARMTADGVKSDISFFVSARAGAPAARILFLAPTATYQAYANTHIKFDSGNTENLYEAPMALSEDELYLNLHRELGLSLYDTHVDDSGVIYAGTRRPMLNSRSGLYTFNYVNDTHIVKWLETNGYDYDIATDEDLHRDGLALLEPYSVVITGSHPEYYSTPMWDALDDYQQGGGRHMYLGGNGFYWRIAWSDDFPGVIENRRGISGVRTWEGEPGEHTLSFTGEPGGLWRTHGRAPQCLVGNGFSSTLFVRSVAFRRRRGAQTEPYDFVFDGINTDIIGDFGYRGGGCVGLEIDRWDAALGSPANSVILATSEDVGAGGLLSGEEFITTTRALDGSQNGNVRADMVIFATGKGGAVWSTGSIAWATSLLWNNGANTVSAVTANVLNRFLDPRPLEDAFAAPVSPPGTERSPG